MVRNLMVLFLVSAVVLAGVVAVSPVEQAAAESVGCQLLNRHSGGNPFLISVVIDPLAMTEGETIVANVTLAGASNVTLEVPVGNSVGSLTADGQLVYTIPATGMYSFKLTTEYGSGSGFTYSFSCSNLPAYPDSDLSAGPDMVQLPDHAVVGRFTANTELLWTPSANEAARTGAVMEIGKTLWVLGVDSTGMYYKVLLSSVSCWVPVSSMGPNYDDVWNGTPLPTSVVN